jgi:FdhD protein
LLPVLSPAAFPELFRELFAAAERASAIGGIHVAALSDGTGLRDVREDVSRHNAVDKTIGAAVLEDAELERFGLLVSARISAEIALKAARSGLAWVASRSIPTSLAVSIAEVAALPLIARAPSSESLVLGGGT